MLSFMQILSMLLDIVWFVVIANVIMNWLINFQVLNIYQPIVAQIWRVLTMILEPIYRPLRSILPKNTGLDFAPLIVLIGLMVVRIIVQNNMANFA